VTWLVCGTATWTGSLIGEICRREVTVLPFGPHGDDIAGPVLAADPDCDRAGTDRPGLAGGQADVLRGAGEMPSAE
jgi:hypothetical protein